MEGGYTRAKEEVAGMKFQSPTGGAGLEGRRHRRCCVILHHPVSIPYRRGWVGRQSYRRNDEITILGFNPLPAGLGWKAYMRRLGIPTGGVSFNPLPAGLGWKGE